MKTPDWMQYAEGEIGVTETPGASHTQRILEYHQETSLGASDDETPWCASFANWVLKQAGIAGTNSAAARSFMQWGKEISEPQYGCIVVLKRGTQSWQGHVGFYVGEEDDGTLWILGGNQSNQVSVSKYQKSQVIGYRMPKRIRDSKTVIATTTGAAATIAGAVTEIADSVTDVAANTPGSGSWVPWVMLAVAVMIGGFIIYERAKKIWDFQI